MDLNQLIYFSFKILKYKSRIKWGWESHSECQNDGMHHNKHLLPSNWANGWYNGSNNYNHKYTRITFNLQHWTDAERANTVLKGWEENKLWQSHHAGGHCTIFFIKSKMYSISWLWLTGCETTEYIVLFWLVTSSN